MRKHIYILIALVVIVSVYTVACKNRPTASSNFAMELEEDKITNTVTPNTNEVKPDVEQEKYDKEYLKQFAGTYWTPANHRYGEGFAERRIEYRFKIIINPDGTAALYKGNNRYQHLYILNGGDKNGQKAVWAGWALHYGTFSKDVIHLTLQGWHYPIVLSRE
mgnify:FL=1